MEGTDTEIDSECDPKSMPMRLAGGRRRWIVTARTAIYMCPSRWRVYTFSAILFAALYLAGSASTVRAADLTELQAEEQLPVVISGGGDHAVKHWDTTGRLLGGIGTHTDAITGLAYARGELVCVVATGRLKGINLATGKTDFEVKAHLEGAIALSLSSDGTQLATGGADSVIRLWDGKTGHFLTDYPKAHGGAITALQLTSDHAHLVTGSVDRMLRIWNIIGDAAHPMIQYHANIVAHDDTVNGISLSPDDKYIASVSSDGSLKVWNLTGGALVQRIRLSAGGLSVVYSPDGRTIATGTADGKVRLWNPETGMALPFAANHDRGVTAIAWTSDGKTLITGGEDKTLRFWNVSTGHQIARITAHDGAVRAIVLP